jgi:hypothetical protein
VLARWLRASSDDRRAQPPEEPAPQVHKPRAVGTTLSQMPFAFLVLACRWFIILGHVVIPFPNRAHGAPGKPTYLRCRFSGRPATIHSIPPKMLVKTSSKTQTYLLKVRICASSV